MAGAYVTDLEPLSTVGSRHNMTGPPTLGPHRGWTGLWLQAQQWWEGVSQAGATLSDDPVVTVAMDEGNGCQRQGCPILVCHLHFSWCSITGQEAQS